MRFFEKIKPIVAAKHPATMNTPKIITPSGRSKNWNVDWRYRSRHDEIYQNVDIQTPSSTWNVVYTEGIFSGLHSCPSIFPLRGRCCSACFIERSLEHGDETAPAAPGTRHAPCTTAGRAGDFHVPTIPNAFADAALDRDGSDAADCQLAGSAARFAGNSLAGAHRLYL
jgi:hypothetical protein